MNMHHITKSLFVGAAIAGIGVSSGRAEITFNEGFRINVRAIVSRALTERCTKLNALYPGTISDVQLREDVDTVCGSLFDRDTGFAHYFTDDFYKAHHTYSDLVKLYKYSEETLKSWLGRNILRNAWEKWCMPDDVSFQGNKDLHIHNALASLVERIRQRQMSEPKVLALEQAGLVVRCYCFSEGYSYKVKWDPVVERLSREIPTVWYPYVLARLSRGKRAHCEVVQKLTSRFDSEFCQAFLISLLKNYSRYLTIKEDLDNKRFTADTYQMYAKFKEVNESLKRMVLLERYSSAKGTQGTGILSFVGYYKTRISSWTFDESEKWALMVEKLEETAKLCKEVEGHPEVKRMSRRHREFMRILADSDNR